MKRIRLFAHTDAEDLDRIQARCHPTWPAKPPNWWWAHPTIVLEVDGKVIGSTSCTVGTAPTPDLMRLTQQRPEVGWGAGVNVDPAWRRHGFGWDLAQARHLTLKAMGVEFFFGMTQLDNKPMLAIFARQQLTRGDVIPKHYPDGSPGVMYHGGII